MDNCYVETEDTCCRKQYVDNQIANLPPQAAPVDADRPTATVPVPPQDTRIDNDPPIEDSVVPHPEPVATKSGRLVKKPVCHKDYNF